MQNRLIEVCLTEGGYVDICKAIKERRMIEFSYEGLLRIVIPTAHGRHVDTENLVLRGYQIGGFSSSRPLPVWSLFRQDSIELFLVLSEGFMDNPPGYVSRDKNIALCCELVT